MIFICLDNDWIMVSTITEQENGMSLRITGYHELRERIVDTVKEVKPNPEYWLDTGCGEGGSIRLSMDTFNDTHFILADPSKENLKGAKKSLPAKEDDRFVCLPTHKLALEDSSLDIITAILSHHYYRDIDSKREAIVNCYRMLKDGGVYLMVEHTIYDDQDIKDKEWREYMAGSGLDESSIDQMFARRNTFYFPFKEEVHIELLKSIGFSKIEVFWRSCSDVGIYAMK